MKAGLAVALSETVCGEPGASSATIKFAVRWPEASGLNTSEIVQLAAGATGAVQLAVKLKSAGLDPPSETEETCNGAFPEFMTVSVCATLEVPWVVAGEENDSAVAEKVMAGIAAMPVPPRRTVCGEDAASSVTIKFAERWPGALGPKTSGIVQLAPGATGAVQLLVKLKSEGLGPLRETAETCSGAVPEFMTVSV